MEKLSEPKKLIYVLLYNKPMNVGDISNHLYGERNSKVSVWLHEMRDDGWIKEVSYEERKKDENGKFKKGTKKDIRYKYYISTAKGLYDDILNELDGLKILEVDTNELKKITFTKEEKDNLLKFLEGKWFRKFISSTTDTKQFLKDKDIFKTLHTIIGHRCIHLFMGNRLYKEKWNIDFTDPKYIEEIAKRNPQLLDLKYLNPPLLHKLANLHPYPVLIFMSFNEFIIAIENSYQEYISQLKNRIKKLEGKN